MCGCVQQRTVALTWCKNSFGPCPSLNSAFRSLTQWRLATCAHQTVGSPLHTHLLLVLRDHISHPCLCSMTLVSVFDSSLHTYLSCIHDPLSCSCPCLCNMAHVSLCVICIGVCVRFATCAGFFFSCKESSGSLQIMPLCTRTPWLGLNLLSGGLLVLWLHRSTILHIPWTPQRRCHSVAHV